MSLGGDVDQRQMCRLGASGSSPRDRVRGPPPGRRSLEQRFGVSSRASRREDAAHEAAGSWSSCRFRTAWPAAARQVPHGVEQIGEVAAEAVELPNDEQGLLAQTPQAAVEAPPVVAKAGGTALVEADCVDVRPRAEHRAARSSSATAGGDATPPTT